jgi:GNAT superfamily N-acetyltransferase
MDNKQILALYDQDRKNIRIFDMQREEDPHIVRHISASGEGVILYSNLNSRNVDKVVREQVAHFEHMQRDFTWVVCQHDTPTNLKDRLLAHGFQIEDPEVIMVLDIEDADPHLLEPTHQDVRRINDPNKIEDILAVRQHGQQNNHSSMAQSLVRRLFDSPDSLVLYVAYVDGKPVSTAQISFFPHGQFAGLVHASTLPNYRKRGLYTALVVARIQEARQRGIRFLDADASPMSRPILEKLGFQCLTESHSCEWQAKQVLPG